MISIKPGVDLSNISPQMAIAHSIVSDFYRDVGQSCRITSGRDGTHTHVLHYVGQALDYGIQGFTQGLLMSLLRDLQAALTSQYDVVCESDHIHVEFDPR